MVNTGKPSPGCFACRKRRIKCDTTRPECRKCRKRGWKCPGYRDLNALRIVDETQKQFTRFSGDKDDDVLARGSSQAVVMGNYVPPEGMSPARTEVLHSYPSPVSEASSPGSPRTTYIPNRYRYQYSDDIPRCIGPPIGEQVYTYFVCNFVQGSSLRNHGYFDFLFPLLGNAPSDRSVNPLRLAFSATAMIAFAARQKVPELLPKAEAIYLRALEATFSAIGDPHQARDDSTLACVTLLTTFEVFYRPNSTTLLAQKRAFHVAHHTDLTPSQQLRPSRPSAAKPEAFGSHLDGAVALLKLRGKELFKTVVGQKIFAILRSLLASRSLCYGAPLDPELFKISESYEQEPAQRRFGELSLRAADLRVTVERYLGGWSPSHPSGGIPTREKIESLMRDADTLEAEYDDHINSLSLVWKAMTLRYMTTSDQPIMGGIRYEGRVDAYADMFICYVLNWSRAARLYIRYCSLRCYAWLLGPEKDWRDTPNYSHAAALCENIIGDIIASVPYVFGATRTPVPGEKYQPPSLAGVFCMWPVFAAASSDFTNDTQRQFLKKTLKYITEEMGIGQAAILAGYNLRSPSMPIAFMRMKQFEAQGRQLQGVAAGAAAGSVMTSGLGALMRVHGSVISSAPDYHPRTIPVGLFKSEYSDDDENFPLKFPAA
ncbi:hypothetical protein N0V82_006391 [Gnomoniopsis sp. IMI 355080]|nr:hypothetical protein N0V82_006391 [Gnomoniopsis sp. IMI 355080]